MVVGVVLRRVETRGLQVQEQVPSIQEVWNARKISGKQGWGARAGCFCLLGADATRKKTRSRSRLKKK